MTPFELNKIKPKVIANECSKQHTINVMQNQIDLLKIAKELAEQVDSLNEKSGEIGEGKCLTMKSLASTLLTYLK
jgi:cell division protein ZapA (FtsZ GTPase activity inhibitor)